MKTMCGGNVIDYNLQGTPSVRLGFGNRTRDDLIVFMAYTFPGIGPVRARVRTPGNELSKLFG